MTAPPAPRAPTGERVTIFRSRLVPEHEHEYHELAAAIEARAWASGGLLEFKTFVAEDGERCSVAVFADSETHERWRREPLHLEAQRAGWERLYESFEILVCQLLHRTEKRPPHGARRWSHD